jgi:hypothetical protein
MKMLEAANYNDVLEFLSPFYNFILYKNIQYVFILYILQQARPKDPVLTLSLFSKLRN